MEKRTLVKSGASSFIIALPMYWIKNNKLSKGDEIFIDEDEKGHLIIQSDKEVLNPSTYCTIKVNKDNQNMFYWELLSAYLYNYTLINVEIKDAHPSITQTILQELKDFIGLGIIEQTKDVIVLKNFSSYDTEISTYSLFKKIDVGIRSIFDIIQRFFLTGLHKENVLELNSQNEYNNRIYLFALKLINSILDSPQLIRVFKTDYRQLIKEHTKISSLRQLSFHFSQIGRLLLFVDKKERGLIKDIMETLQKKYRTIVTLPGNPLSKEILFMLNESNSISANWELSIRKMKNPFLIEVISHSLTINNLLDQLAVETIA